MRRLNFAMPFKKYEKKKSNNEFFNVLVHSMCSVIIVNLRKFSF